MKKKAVKVDYTAEENLVLRKLREQDLNGERPFHLTAHEYKIYKGAMSKRMQIENIPDMILLHYRGFPIAIG